MEPSRIIGSIEEGISGNVLAVSGCLNTGEVSGVPIIKSIMSKLPKEEIVIIDCPPGSACVVMESIRSADFCVLVAEPTIFGTHNLAMVYDLVKFFNKPTGVLLNKCLDGQENPSEEFCINNKINILAKIPFDEQLGSLNSQGFISVREDNKYKELFENLLTTIEKEILQ
jgi:MinD superfamily P-loop ATPase